jgi:hypothetical protein
MGFYTELIFNEVMLADEGVARLRQSAAAVQKDENCKWSYMLDYLYVEDDDNRTIDLGLSPELTATLKKYCNDSLVPWDRIDDPQFQADVTSVPEDRQYFLRWEAFENKWYDVAEFVAWVCAFCVSGRILQLTCEEDGGLWGYEIGEGQYCELALTESSPWKKAVRYRARKAAPKQAATKKAVTKRSPKKSGG